ncbi:hypothetical protein QFZ61_001022 [Arthrobacter sp. B3I4]|nr:hypothetical protein [Arthrobacter sp. B3I4]
MSNYGLDKRERGRKPSRSPASCHREYPGKGALQLQPLSGRRRWPGPRGSAPSRTSCGRSLCGLLQRVRSTMGRNPVRAESRSVYSESFAGRRRARFRSCCPSPSWRRWPRGIPEERPEPPAGRGARSPQWCSHGFGVRDPFRSSRWRPWWDSRAVRSFGGTCQRFRPAAMANRHRGPRARPSVYDRRPGGGRVEFECQFVITSSVSGNACCHTPLK